jgi:folylpolyglutamate synthase/dihydropteroate synthase
VVLPCSLLTSIRWDCITINDTPVSKAEFVQVESHFKKLDQDEGINASEFELLTATAFELFNRKKVKASSRLAWAASSMPPTF